MAATVQVDFRKVQGLQRLIACTSIRDDQTRSAAETALKALSRDCMCLAHFCELIIVLVDNKVLIRQYQMQERR